MRSNIAELLLLKHEEPMEIIHRPSPHHLSFLFLLSLTDRIPLCHTLTSLLFYQTVFFFFSYTLILTGADKLGLKTQDPTICVYTLFSFRYLIPFKHPPKQWYVQSLVSSFRPSLDNLLPVLVCRRTCCVWST